MTLDTNQSGFDEDAAAEDDATLDAQATEEDGATDGEEDGAQDDTDLLARFAAAPEGQALQAEGLDLAWVERMLDYASDELEVTPAEMTPEQMRELLFRGFPAQVAAPPTDAPIAVREIRAFWQFLEREGQPNAADIVAVLDDKAARRMEIAMSNPALYGETKAFLMGGMARGYDMTTEEGRAAWAEIYEAEQATKSMQPFLGAGAGMLGGADLEGADLDEDLTGTGSGTHRKSPSKTQQKAKRKMAKASQRKNRKK
jgi:hypothetical protein